jgi:exosortase E/protease (VPEID-CTERM system)
VADGESSPSPPSKTPLGCLSPGGNLSSELAVNSVSTQKIPNTVRERLIWLVVLFALELTGISVWLDAASLSRRYFLTHLMLNWGAWTLRGAVAFAFLFPIFAYLRNPSGLAELFRRKVLVSVRPGLLASHFLSLAAFGALARPLFAAGQAGPWANVLAAGFLASGLLAIALATLALLPLEVWRDLIGGSGYLWAYAGAGSAIVCWLGGGLRLLWGPSTRVTFLIVRILLKPFLSTMVSDPGTATIGSASFQVYIAPYCSGLEGMALMLVFSLIWLWLCRRELRFPQAILLVPISLCAAFLLNSMRIAALVLIGNAGAVNIAMGGFHSQAGWIGFNLIALGLVIGSRHAKWISREPRQVTTAATGDGADNLSAVYLAPFAAILAAGMVSRAAAGQFEWLYPIRICAVAAVLWFYRRSYSKLDWSFGWLGAAAGAAVFAFWIGIAGIAAGGAAASHLLSGHGVGWTMWLVLRVVGAVIAVPIAEELAFRGYLLRRIHAADFESVSFQKVSLTALAVSSVAFGSMHGNRWIAGSVAGLAYALVLRRRGRIGEAVAAHAVTNALLAVWVIARGEWGLW